MSNCQNLSIERCCILSLFDLFFNKHTVYISFLRYSDPISFNDSKLLKKTQQIDEQILNLVQLNELVRSYLHISW